MEADELLFIGQSNNEQKKVSCRRETVRQCDASCHWIFCWVTQGHSIWHCWV